MKSSRHSAQGEMSDGPDTRRSAIESATEMPFAADDLTEIA